MPNMLSHIDFNEMLNIPVCDETARTTAGTNAAHIGSMNSLLTNDKDNLVNAINEVFQQDLEHFRNKSVCIIGDSISAVTTYPPNWTVPFTEAIESVNGTVTNLAVDGASISGWAIDVNMIPTDKDIYIFFLGINDFIGQWPAINGNLFNDVNTLLTRVNGVGKEVWYISPLRMLGANSMDITKDNICPANAYRYLLETAFNNGGAKVISGLGAPDLNLATMNTYMTDGLHPQPAYRHILANYILKNIANDIISFSNTTITKTSTPALTGTGNVEYTWLNNAVDITINISGAALNANFTPICKTSNVAGTQGIIPTTYFPNMIRTNSGEVMYIKHEGDTIYLLPFSGAGNYDINVNILVPIFGVNNVG